MISQEEKLKNLELWNTVRTTPKERTKKVKLGALTLTTINPQWQLNVATALWGPYGSTWGVKSLQYEYMELPKPVKEYIDGKWKTVAYRPTMCCFLTATFFYPNQDGTVGEIELSNDTVAEAGDDHRKKLLTDLTTKALSKLGFSADVFLGEHDTKY